MLFKPLELLKGAWSLIVVVIPATFWLAKLDANGQENTKAIQEVEAQMFNTQKEYVEIKTALGEIKGELKRIRR